MKDLFQRLGPDDISVHVLLNLQEKYPDLDKHEMSAYRHRVELRLSLLRELAERSCLPISSELVSAAVTGIDKKLVAEICSRIGVDSGVPLRNDPAERRVTMMCGGPATGKSSLIKKKRLAEDAVCLDRDALLDRLDPYPRLKTEYPDRATHAVVCEAILYNERDAFRYSILGGAGHVFVDGTMSYLDLGLEMIKFAQENKYRVSIINVDCPIDEAERRAVTRAERMGKTINPKLLYESHVRCAKHFLEYRQISDSTESWRNDGDAPSRLTASTQKAQGGDILEDVIDAAAFEEFRHKGTLPLDNPSWPPIFDEFLDQRKR